MPIQMPSPAAPSIRSATRPATTAVMQKMMEHTTQVSDYDRYFKGVDRIEPGQPRILNKIDTPKGVVYLTFDDGPYSSQDHHQASTDQLLGVLKEKNAHATFFLQGYWSWKNPQIVQDIVAQGSNVGNHTYHHCPDGGSEGPITAPDEKFARLTSSQQLKEILWDRGAEVGALSGHTSGITHYFRAPHGDGVDVESDDKVDARTVQEVAASGYTIVDGNLGLSDVGATSKGLISHYKSFFSKGNPLAHKGEILWMHSGLSATVQALPKIIDILHHDGYQVEALP